MAGITRIYEILQLIGLDKSETMKHKIIEYCTRKDLHMHYTKMAEYILQ